MVQGILETIPENASKEKQECFGCDTRIGGVRKREREMKPGTMLQHNKTNSYFWFLKDEKQKILVLKNKPGIGIVTARIPKSHILTDKEGEFLTRGKVMPVEDLAANIKVAEINDALEDEKRTKENGKMATARKSKKTEKKNGGVTHGITRLMLRKKGASAREIHEMVENEFPKSSPNIVQSIISVYRGKKKPGFALKKKKKDEKRGGIVYCLTQK